MGIAIEIAIESQVLANIACHASGGDVGSEHHVLSYIVHA